MPEQQKNNVESQRAVIDARLAVIEQELRGLVLREKAVAEEGESKAAALKGAGKQGIEWSQFAIAPKKLQATKGIEAQRQKLEQEKQHLQTVKETLRAQETGKKEKLPERERQAVEHIEGVVAGTRAEVDRAPKEVKPAVVGLAGQAKVAGQKAVDTVRAVVRRGPNTGEPSPQPEKEKPMKEEKEKIKAEKKAEKEKETLTNRFAGLKAKRDALLADGFTPPAEISQYIETIDQDIGALQTLLDNNKFEKVKNSFASLRGKLDECANQIALAQNEAALTAQSQKVEEQKKPIKEAAPVIPEQKTEKQKFQIVGVEGKMEAGTHGSLGDYTVGDTLQVIDPKKVGADVNNAASLTVVGIAGDKILIQIGEGGPSLLAEPKRVSELFRKTLKEEPISGAEIVKIEKRQQQQEGWQEFAGGVLKEVQAEERVADAAAQRLRNPSTKQAAIVELISDASVSAQKLYPKLSSQQRRDIMRGFVEQEIERSSLSDDEKAHIAQEVKTRIQTMGKDLVESYFASPAWTKKPDAARFFEEEKKLREQTVATPPSVQEKALPSEEPIVQPETGGGALPEQEGKERKQRIIADLITHVKQSVDQVLNSLGGLPWNSTIVFKGETYTRSQLSKALFSYRRQQMNEIQDLLNTPLFETSLQSIKKDLAVNDRDLEETRKRIDAALSSRTVEKKISTPVTSEEPAGGGKKPSGEAVSTPAQKPSLLSRFGAGVRGLFRRGVDLDKRATEKIQRSEATFIEKLRQVPWKEKIATALLGEKVAKGGFLSMEAMKSYASIIGVRIYHDLPMFVAERLEKRTVINETLAALENALSAGEGGREEKVNQAVSALEDRIKKRILAHQLLSGDVVYLREQLAVITGADAKETEAIKNARHAEIRSILERAVTANTSSVQVAREGLNALLVASGGLALRAVGYGAMAVADRLTLLHREKAKKGETIFTKEGLAKDFLLNGFTETYQELRYGSKEKGTETTGKQKFMTRVKALGVVGRFAGIGLTAGFRTADFGDQWQKTLDLLGGKMSSGEVVGNYSTTIDRFHHLFTPWEWKPSEWLHGSAKSTVGAVSADRLSRATGGGGLVEIESDTQEIVSHQSFAVDNRYGHLTGDIKFHSSPETATFMKQNGITFDDTKCRYEFANEPGGNYFNIATDRTINAGDGKIDIASVKLTMDDGELRITTFSHPDSDGNVHVAHLVTDGKDLTQFDGDVNYDYATHDVRAVVSEKGTMTKIAKGDVDRDGLMDRRSETADLAVIHLKSWKDGSGVSHTREAIGALRLQNGDVLHTTLLDANNDSVITDKDIAEGLYVATKGDETTIDSFIAVPSSENGKFPDGMTLRETLQEMHRLDPTISESLNIKDAQGIGHAQEVFRNRLDEMRAFEQYPYLKGHMQEAQALGITRSGNAVDFGDLDKKHVESLFNDKAKLELCYEGDELNKGRLAFVVEHSGDVKDYLGALFSATDETNARLGKDWSYEDFSNTIGKEMEKVPLNFEANSNGVVATIDGNQYLFTKGFVQKVNMLSDKYSLSSAPPSPIRNAILEYGNPVVLSSIVDRQKFHEALSLAQNQSAVTH